eukprot:CAMPEP_0115606510 /NCGR_PEP_ID=MMETSP0272-20121206/18019_1 /TAXON_ID=71861 /ORGANISM="Scrippsiella trochoidea, Strain CCMP3099" /LENGTH=85 /DNA_ID=CAMNT_0003042143 /DNA_START=283 /DNA_END=537 /DNA_ORIENTATION=+
MATSTANTASRSCGGVSLSDARRTKTSRAPALSKAPPKPLCTQSARSFWQASTRRSTDGASVRKITLHTQNLQDVCRQRLIRALL